MTTGFQVQRMKKKQRKLYRLIGCEKVERNGMIEQIEGDEINISELKALNDIYMTDIRGKLEFLHEELSKERKKLRDLIEDNERLDLIAEIFENSV